jgi:hypothetical protein
MSLAIAHSKAIEAMQSSLENWSFLLGKSFCFNSHLPFLHGVVLSSPPHSSLSLSRVVGPLRKMLGDDKVDDSSKRTALPVDKVDDSIRRASSARCFALTKLGDSIKRASSVRCFQK